MSQGLAWKLIIKNKLRKVLMTRTFSFLFLFLFLASCGKGGGGGSDGVSMAELTDAELSSSSVPVQAQTFEVNATLKGFERSQEDKIYTAIDLIKRVVATDEFKRRVLNKKYNGKKTYVDNNGLTNAQVYKKILEASENLNPGANNTMDITLESYHTTANVIGYTMPNINTVYLNKRYLDKASFKANQVAMNVTHEWLHKIGFKHAYENTANRSHSVPYAVGYIMRDIAAKIM
jgi:hypothetical protein